MEQYIIKGGNPLVGDVTISGAKNAALGILAASIMTDDDVLIDNLPDVRDINVLLEAIEEIGARVERIDRHTVKINGSNIKEVSVDDEYTVSYTHLDVYKRQNAWCVSVKTSICIRTRTPLSVTRRWMTGN